MSGVNNCLPFERARARTRTPKRDLAPAAVLSEIFEDLTPAQFAFLTGVLALLADHGADALTRSCEMVIERFGRQAG